MPDVDLDLDALRPPNRTFRHRGKVYEIPAEMAVETIIEALQLREKFDGASRSQGESERRLAALEAELETLDAELSAATKAEDPERALEINDQITAVEARREAAAAEAGEFERAMVRAMEALRGIIWRQLDEAGTLEAVPSVVDPDAVGWMPVGATLVLPEGRRVTRTEEGLRVEEVAYPRMSIEEVTAILTLAMSGRSGDTPEAVVREAIAPDVPAGDGEGGPEDPTPSTSASAETAETETAPIAS